MKYRILPVCLSLAALFVMGCDKEDDISDTYRGHSRVKSSEDYSIHKFVHETFSAYYYWADNVPQYKLYRGERGYQEMADVADVGINVVNPSLAVNAGLSHSS